MSADFFAARAASVAASADFLEALFAVTWTIHDKNGQSGSIRIYNSYR